MRELLIKWLREGVALQPGEELYIPVDNQTSQTDFYNLLRKELTVMRQLDSEAVKLRIFTTFKDRQFWVVIKKITVTPLVAYRKGLNGTVERVNITNDKDKLRIVRLKEADNAKKTA